MSYIKSNKITGISLFAFRKLYRKAVGRSIPYIAHLFLAFGTVRSEDVLYKRHTGIGQSRSSPTLPHWAPGREGELPENSHTFLTQ